VPVALAGTQRAFFLQAPLLARKMSSAGMGRTVMAPRTVAADAFLEHRRFVKRTLRYLGVPLADADDALQQVFMVVHRRSDEYARIERKQAWLASVSHLVSKNYHRGVRRARARRLDFAPEPALDTEELFARQEAGRLQLSFLAKLKVQERSAFYLAYVEGLTAREIARKLEVNMNTVYARLRYARLRFDKRLAGRG
jgi:RNA polymerase sigma-70 factor (ECF subfamily)